MKNWLIILIVFIANIAKAQYTLYTTGSTIDTITHPHAATLLMGGATENDSAMARFLKYADGGDIVVLRATGADGYNAYFYSQLGVYVHSVKTFVVNTIAGANDSVVVQAVRNAEAVWIAGGDQYNYVQFWRGTALNTTLNYLINTKRVPFGGTSAGMAIQPQYYFNAQNGSVTSATALGNPYDAAVTVDHTPFINNVQLKDIISDTHFDNPDRKGRTMTFLARTWKDEGKQISAIACEEYTAVWLDTNNKGYVFGSDPTDFAYFITIDCAGNNTIENCSAGQALNWHQDNTVVKAYKVVGNNQATNYFDIRNFTKNIQPNSGGVWEDWWVDNGTFNSASGAALQCAPQQISAFKNFDIQLYPNPANTQINILNHEGTSVQMYITDLTGKVLIQQYLNSGLNIISTQHLQKGIFILSCQKGNVVNCRKIIIE